MLIDQSSRDKHRKRSRKGVNDRIVWRTLVALNGSLFEHMCVGDAVVGGITAGRRVCRDGSAVKTAPKNSIKPGHLPRPTTAWGLGPGSCSVRVRSDRCPLIFCSTGSGQPVSFRSRIRVWRS